MRMEIKACMGEVSRNGDSIAAEFVFPCSFKGFKGHFPDKPVLPGVCMVQVALVLVDELTNRKCRLQRIGNAKFLSVVEPEQAVQVECSVQGNAVRASFMSGETRIATLKLAVADA